MRLTISFAALFISVIFTLYQESKPDSPKHKSDCSAPPILSASF